MAPPRRHNKVSGRYQTRENRGVVETVKRWLGFTSPPGEQPFDGAGRGRRTRNWNATSGGPNAVTLGSLQSQRNQARDLARKVPWVASAIDAVAADIVGQGIRPSSLATGKGFRKQVEDLWRDWVMESDADGIASFYGQQLLAVRTMIEAGECFIRFRPRRISDGLPVPLQIQVLEPEFVPLDNAMGLLPRPGNVIKQGIEFDKLGKRVAYWMYREHPYDYAGLGQINHLQVVRVPADEVLHLYKPVRPGQVRGVPWLSTVIIRVRDLLEYEDAELVRKKIAAMFVAFVTKNANGDNVLQIDDDEEVDDPSDDESAPLTMEPGSIQQLEEGESTEFSNPPDSGNNYEAFLRTQLRAIASALGAMYEAVTGDYSNSNFSNARMGRMLTQRRTSPVQDGVNFQMNIPIWKRFIRDAVTYGMLSAPAFTENPRDYTRVDFVAPGWPYANPKEEATADQIRIQSGLASRKGVARERGKEIEDIDRDISEDNARADGLGIVTTSDGRFAVKMPSPASADGGASSESASGGSAKSGA